MKRSLLCCSVLVLLQIMSWVSATSRVLPPGGGYESRSPEYSTSEEEEWLEEMKKIGSTPPNCESKCYGCSPCVAIQVPTTTNGHFSLQYSNYLPEGWKCKCGPSLYTP